MPKQEPQGAQGEFISYRDTLSYGFGLAYGLSALSEPFVNYRVGKRYYGLNVAFGLGVLALWIVFHPGHEPLLLRFGGVWLAAVACQTASAHWSHYFGRRQITVSMGEPFIRHVLPFGMQFCRRVLNPLLVFGAGCLMPDTALSLLLKGSGIGQMVMCTFLYSVKSAEDDQRSDAMLLMRNR